MRELIEPLESFYYDLVEGRLGSLNAACDSNRVLMDGRVRRVPARPGKKEKDDANRRYRDWIRGARDRHVFQRGGSRCDLRGHQRGEDCSADTRERFPSTSRGWTRWSASIGSRGG